MNTLRRFLQNNYRPVLEEFNSFKKMNAPLPSTIVKSVRIDRRIVERLQGLATDADKTPSDLIREAVAAYICSSVPPASRPSQAPVSSGWLVGA